MTTTLARERRYVEEGVGREDAFLDGAYRDTHYYGVLEREWRARADDADDAEGREADADDAEGREADADDAEDSTDADGD
jgi:hypothetical protein